MKLIIVHYHLRPGGIRRVIELAAPQLVRRLKRVESVVLACGEAGDRKWNRHFRQLLHPVPAEFFIEPAFNYFSEQKLPPGGIACGITSALEALFRDLPGPESLIWAHNLGVARNLILARELARFADERGAPLLSHHHDWWFDQRWLRRAEIRRAGFRDLDSVARAIFPPLANVRHAAINHADAAILKHHLPRRSAWLPNPALRGDPPLPARARAARRWLQRQLGGGDAPVWLLPCRFLRRKNIAEALLLTRWLRPEARLVTTGGVSSADEAAYYRKLSAAARRHNWPARFGILQGDESRKPAVADLMAASECVLLTSLQEGFGLPYIEAAAARRPLVARSLPEVAPDLKKFGFRFPQSYGDVLVPSGLFDWQAERARQAKMFGLWRQKLPRACRAWASPPAFLAHERPEPVPFSRLTLTAQLEVLAHPADQSWELCAPLNPFLVKWREPAVNHRLRVTPWPRQAGRWLGGPAYAQRFYEIAYPGKRTSRPVNAAAIQEEFIRKKLGAEHQFPLLWSRES